MVTVEATKTREGFSDLLNQVRYGSDRVRIVRRGKDVAVLVSVEDARFLEMFEDHFDIAAAGKALANPKNKTRIRWEKVKKDLGL